MKKLAIIGASYLQNPLILKAKEMGLETYAFAWKAGDIGEKTADHFYPISIIEKDKILEKCREIDIDGICTISSDLGAVTVGYVANKMGLVGNPPDCIEKSTNKWNMRQAFAQNGDPSPKSIRVTSPADVKNEHFQYPVIVKPADRSGSRGVSKLMSVDGMDSAIEAALDESFSKEALVEEYARGKEYSVEFLSWHGHHHFLAITEKFTTGAPHFIERGHLQPARLSESMREKVAKTVSHALDSLHVQNGASHSELKIDENGTIRIIEIGARMGGDFIGSDMVRMSTGYDFLAGVIEVALGEEPDFDVHKCPGYAGVRFIFAPEDVDAFHKAQELDEIHIVSSEIPDAFDHEVTDSANRYGYFLFKADSLKAAEEVLPKHTLSER